MSFIKTLGRLAGPLYLALVALTYMMGVGASRYLGFPLRGRLLVQGLVLVILFQLAMDWLNAAFFQLSEMPDPGGQHDDPARVRTALLSGATGALAAAAVLLFVLIRFNRAPILAMLGFGLSLVAIVLYAIPPMRATDRGFGELLLAVQIAYLVPSLGFLLQADAYHPLLNVSTVALTSILIASLLVLELPHYGEDTGRGRLTLLTRMGWERALMVHHMLLAAAYLLLGLSIVFAFSFSLIGPGLLTLPFALLQVLLLRAIAGGARPIWNLLRANAVAIFAMTAYFLTLSFWLR